MSGPLALVYPAMAQVLLTLVVLLLLAFRRGSALSSGRVRTTDVALSGDAWPEDARKIGNNLRNQFETPVLFYVLCGVATYLASTNLLMALLAWGYVATRVVHCAIHVTTNRIEQRSAVFALGVVILIIMWAALAAKLLLSA